MMKKREANHFPFFFVQRGNAHFIAHLFVYYSHHSIEKINTGDLFVLI